MSYLTKVLNELASEARAMLNIPKDHYTGLIVGFGYQEIEYERGTFAVLSGSLTAENAYGTIIMVKTKAY